MDPLADNDHNISLTPYHYCANNPILFIDPFGEDWYVNGENGQVLFVKDAVGDLNEEQIEQYGSGWNNIGSNDMFGDNVVYDDINVLDFNSVEFSIGAAQDFMHQQGYLKGNEAIVEKKQMEGQSLDLDGRNYPNEANNEKIIKQQITYALPEKMNTSELLGTKSYSNFTNDYKSITRTYKYTMPWNTKYQTQKTLSKNNAKQGLFKKAMQKAAEFFSKKRR